MTHSIHVQVKCPNCSVSLQNEKVSIDQLPSIELEAKLEDKVGKIYLSQLYGSFAKKFEGVKDIMGSIASFSCPHCHQPFPVVQICDCKAPLIGLQLEVGGLIKICSRNGCKKHALEFEDVNDALKLLLQQDSSGLG
ncbi:MAG: hypothetical protein Kow0037_09200 [Calditrichia bacterium]